MTSPNYPTPLPDPGRKADVRAKASRTILSVLAIVLLLTIPFVLNPGGTFGGSDNAGADAIRQLAPQYDAAWIRNWWRPPGAETESLLFALQATVGGLLIGYVFGYLRGRKAAVAVAAASAGEGQ